MRWEAFKARNLPSAAQDTEPPHMIRQHFALSSRKVESAGASFEVCSVAPMKFDGGAQALEELDPSAAAQRAVLYLAPLERRSWDFIAQLADANLRVDIPTNWENPAEAYAQLAAQHDHVTVIADGPAAPAALELPAALILNSPIIRRPAEIPPAPVLHIWSGSEDPHYEDAAALAEACGGHFHGVAGAIPMFHLTHTPEGKAAVRDMIHLTRAD